jgi:hypothetical protein
LVDSVALLYIHRAPFAATVAQLTLPCQLLTSRPGVWTTFGCMIIRPEPGSCLATWEPGQSLSGWVTGALAAPAGFALTKSAPHIATATDRAAKRDLRAVWGERLSNAT